MKKPLPVSGFEWSTITVDEIRDYDPSPDNEVGYFVEVDAQIPGKLGSDIF